MLLKDKQTSCIMPANTRYDNACLYKIYCILPHVQQCFVGCSCNVVKVRALHKAKTADMTIQTPFYQFIRNNGGFTAWRIDMINYYPSTCPEDMRTGVMECMLNNPSWNCYLNMLQMKTTRKTHKHKGIPQPRKSKIIKPEEPIKKIDPIELNKLMMLIEAPIEKN